METFLTPNFLIIIGCIVTVLVFLFYLFYRHEKGFGQKQENVVNDNDHIILDAQAKAREIIEQAGTQAATMLTQAQSAKLDVDLKENDAFKKITEEQIQLLHTNSEEYFREYQTSLAEVKNHYTEQLGQMLSDMRDTTEKEIQELKTLLKTQVTASGGASSKQIQDDFAKAQIEIAEYKKHQLQKIDLSINDVLLKVSEEILGKVISVRDHQQIIIDSLEQAKKEGLFSI